MNVTVDDLQAFADAWNRHDVEALMSSMTDDCVFEASAGPEVCGTSYVGRATVEAGLFRRLEKLTPTRSGVPLAIFCAVIVGSPSGRSPARGRTVPGWMSMGATCSPSVTERSQSRILIASTGRRFLRAS